MSEEMTNAATLEQISEELSEKNEPAQTEVAENEAIETAEPVVTAEQTEVAETADEDALAEDYLQVLADKSLKEIIETFEKLVERNDQQEMYKYAEGLKAAFYKALKRDKIAAGCYPPAADVANPESETTGKEDKENDMVVSQNPFEQVERGFKELYAKYRASRNAYLAEVEKKKEENLAVRLQLIEELKNLVENQEDPSKTFPAFRTIQTKWRESGPVPAPRVKDIYETYQHNVEKFYDYVKINNELRDLDFKKNLEIKEKLCEKAEALVSSEKVVEAFNELQKLHEEWKELGPVDKEHRESIWERFKEATAQINKKHQAHFESLKEHQKENLAKKTELCEQLEALIETPCTGSGEWNKVSSQIEELQKVWRTIGFASKKDNQKIYDRFRAACDKFFEGKRDFYTEFKDSMSKNLEAKEALCGQAEQLAESTDWKKTTDTIIELQKKWKEIGPVPRKKSDAVWARFRAACDKFFSNKDNYFAANRSAANSRGRSDRGSKGAGPARSEREKLVQKYHKLETEIATYENNMGFFANSKGADVFIAGIKKKIEEARAELVELEVKIKSLE